MKSAKECTHLPKKGVKPQSDECQECGQKMSIRVCMDCGFVGCCESSPGQHALKHSKKSGHKVIKSYPPDQDGAFTWCYECNDYVKTTNRK